MTLKDILTTDKSPDEVLEAVRARFGRYFDEQGGNPRRVAELIHSGFPDRVERVIAQADLAMKGMHILPGTGGLPYFVGDPPKWDENPVNDNEYVWVLNRMNFLIPLIEAYIYTGNQGYCDKALYLTEHWIDNCLRPSIEFLRTKCNGGRPVSGWRTLEAGIRMFSSWAYALRFFIIEDKLSPELFEKILISVYEHGEALAEVPIVYWPDAGHNHYLMENAGLFTLACYFPELKRAGEWLDLSMRELERCSTAQLTVDGGQIEGCPGYHHGCVYWFYIVAARAKSFGLSFSGEYMERLKKAVDYSVHCHRPMGDNVLWGDSFTSNSGVLSALLGYLLFDDPEHINIVANYVGTDVLKKVISDSADKIDSERDIKKLIDGRFVGESAGKLATVTFQRGLDQFIARTGWDKDALSLFFACRLPINNTHAHIDPMSFDFSALGQCIIADPGAFCYREDSQREKYKSAKWHSLLTVNDKSPFEYISSWEFGPQKDGRILRTGCENGLIYAEAVHTSYEPAIHKRFIAIIDNCMLIVLDRVENLSGDDFLRLYYHLDSTDVKAEAADTVVSRHGSVVTTAVFSKLTYDIQDGTIAGRIDAERPSKRIVLSDNSNAKTRVLASLFIPRREACVQAAIKDYQYSDSAISFELSVNRDTITRTLLKN